jgi:hypothetical protein
VVSGEEEKSTVPLFGTGSDVAVTLSRFFQICLDECSDPAFTSDRLLNRLPTEFATEKAFRAACVKHYDLITVTRHTLMLLFCPLFDGHDYDEKQIGIV